MTSRQWLLLTVGIAMVASGLFSLCSPILLSSYDRWGIQINCGTSYQSDLLQASIADSAHGGSLYTAQCQHALANRRGWAIPLTGVGAALFSAELTVWALSKELSAARRSLSRNARVPSLRSEILAVVAYLWLRPWMGVIRPSRFIVALSRLWLRMICMASRPVGGCVVETVHDPVAGEWVRAPGADDHAGVVLLLHGGGYIACSPRTHRGFASRISLYSGLPVFTLRYRLAPEYPFPAADDDANSAYRWLLDQGVSPAKVVVVGDSAGGHLAIALVARARDEGLPLPAALTLFGPLIDPSFKTAMADQRNLLNPISPRVAQRFLTLYIGTHDIDDPRLSLLNASAGGLPRIQLHYGTLEVMRAEIELFAARVTEADRYCEQRVWPNLLHGYWLFPQFVPEAQESLRAAGRFVHDAVHTQDRGYAAVEGIKRARGGAAVVS